MSAEYLELAGKMPELSQEITSISPLSSRSKITPAQKIACRRIKEACNDFIEQTKTINETQQMVHQYGSILSKKNIKERVKIFRDIDQRKVSLKKWLVLKSLLGLVAVGNTSYGLYRLIAGGETDVCNQIGIGTLVNFGLGATGIIGPWLPIKILRPFSLYGDIRELIGLSRLQSTVEALDQTDAV